MKIKIFFWDSVPNVLVLWHDRKHHFSIVIDDKLRAVIDSSQQGQFIKKNTFYHGQLLSTTIIVNNELFVDNSNQVLFISRVNRLWIAHVKYILFQE